MNNLICLTSAPVHFFKILTRMEDAWTQQFAAGRGYVRSQVGYRFLLEGRSTMLLAKLSPVKTGYPPSQGLETHSYYRRLGRVAECGIAVCGCCDEQKDDTRPRQENETASMSVLQTAWMILESWSLRGKYFPHVVRYPPKKNNIEFVMARLPNVSWNPPHNSCLECWICSIS